MARQLSIEEKRSIILLYLDGFSQHAIAKKTRRSIGIVNAVISDWETGKGIEPESGLLSGEIREIARFMKEKNLSISELDEMFLTDTVLKESGLNKPSILKIMRGFKGIGDEELEKYAETVMRIRRVEDETHISIDKLHDVVTEEEESLSKIRKEKAELEREIQEMKSDLTSLSKQYNDEKEDIEFSKNVRNITGAHSNNDVLSILAGLKNAAFDAPTYLRLKELLERVENIGISIDNFVSAANDVLALRDMGFSLDYLEKLRAELAGSKLDFRRIVDQFMDYQRNMQKFDLETREKEKNIGKLKEELEEKGSALAKLRGEENVLRNSISSLQSKKKVLEAKISELTTQIETQRREYDRLVEMNNGLKIEAEATETVLRTYKEGFKNYNDLNMGIGLLNKRYSDLKKEYEKRKEEVDLGLALFGLLTESPGYDLEGLKLMCSNLLESPAVGDRDLHKIKLKAIELLIKMTQNNLVALSSTDGDMLKIKFVSKEEYYENMQKFLEIERMKQEIESIQEMVKKEAYKFVKAELESRGEDPAIRPYIREVVKEVIRERCEAEAQRISDEELMKSGTKVLLSLPGFGEGTGTKEGRVGEFIRLVYLDDSGKTGEDAISLEKVLKSLLEGKEVEGSYYYYDSCEALKAIIFYYAKGKTPPIKLLRKKGEIRIFKGSIVHPP
ncbi:MAG: hypothetical protein LVQ63_00625 [Thermoplasmatales archaeon]|nr:hypothetical protein [Thermoplasmatales archaeon]